MPSGFVALRSPLLPFGVLEDWCGGFRCARHPEDEALWIRDRERARARLRTLLSDPAVREAIFLASPSLHERTGVWLDDPDGDAGSGIEAGLVKYVTRMASRCTPFGLFAGNSVGTIASHTRLELLEREAGVRHTRLDMELLDAVVARLAGDSVIRDQLGFSTNSSLYAVGGTYRYAEARTVEGRRAYFLVDVEAHDHLERALARARAGARLDEIAGAIADDEVPYADARAFVERLVDANLLVPDLGPVVTGPESVDELIERLHGIPAAEGARSVLVATREALVDMDAEGAVIDPARYGELATGMGSLAPVEPGRLVQVDLVKPAAELTVSGELIAELSRAVQVLLDLFAHDHRDPLEAFRTAFEDRYGQVDVPLVEALDEELGVGYQTAQGPGADPSPLLAGLPFPAPEEEDRVGWGSRGAFLAWKLGEAIAAGAEELVLQPGELGRFHDPQGPRLAGAFHILASLLEADPADGDAAHAILDSAGGPSGVRLLGRFCHGDPELRDHVLRHLRAEEALAPGVRYFEIVHLPEGRTGNILARPVLRDLELAYLGASGAPPEKTLHIDDLLVGLRNGRVVLRSRSLGCEVRPRMTTAHNTQWRSLGIYRFLAALQAEGVVEGVSWSWGPLGSLPRLPRVRLGRIVLARARWNAHRAEIEMLRRPRGHAAFRQVQAWRRRRGLPRWVGLIDQDNVLTVDLDHPLSVAAFLDALRGQEQATLQEVFPGGRTDPVVAPEGRFVNEIVVPMVRSADEGDPAGHGGARSGGGREAEESSPRPATAGSARPAPAGEDPPEPVFAPGSEWLTVKLYTGPALADRVLEELVVPLVLKTKSEGTVDRWFFLRYADPDWHLRVRFRGDRLRLAGQLLPALHDAAAPFLADRRVHRIQLDTYARETRRYGGPQGVEASERIFWRDSEAVASFLAGIGGDEGLDARWRYAFVAMDRLLDDLGLDLDARHGLADRLAAAYGEEFSLDSALRGKLRERYRTERPALEAALDEEGESGELLAGGYATLRVRSGQVRAACGELRRLAANGTLSVSVDEIAASLLHMHANRVLRSANRAQEMVLYRFLEKTYASRRARRKGSAGARREQEEAGL